DPALITPTVLGGAVSVGDRVRTATVRGQTVIWKTSSDSGWVDLTQYVRGGITVHVARGRRQGDFRIIKADLDHDGNGFRPDGTDVIEGLPSMWRPADNMHGAAWLTGGIAGVAWVRANGSVSTIH